MRLRINKTKLLTIFTIVIFLCSYCPIIVQGDIEEIDNPYKDITKLEWIGPHGSYEDYLNSRTNLIFSINTVTKTILNKDDPTIIIIINSYLIPDLDEEICTYNHNLIVNDYNTIIIELSGGTVEDIKSEIVSYWNSGYNITGAVLVGNHPAAWYYLSYDSSSFPCDLFLMDLDGQWLDTDSDGMYDSHTDGSGDAAPEIYVGRIDASNIPGDEINITKAYFNKNNNFWIGNTTHTDYGLTYTEPDWSTSYDIRFSMQYAYENYEAIWEPNTSRDDYLYNRVSNDAYEFIQLACHSASFAHRFDNGGYLFNHDIRDAPPQALFYNLFCCGATRFTDWDCLGNAYILDTNSPSLSVVGSAKSGSMLYFLYYYRFLANHSFGKAFQLWFEFIAPYSEYDKSWFYGMNILGDPTLCIWGPKMNTPPYPPDEPVGPDYGEVDVEYSFTTSTTDPQEDQIFYMWSWGNESSDWMGPYNSGETIQALHTWMNPGVYPIKVKAKDDTGEESEWSEEKYIEIVSIPKIIIGEISGGFGVKAEIKNIGSAEAINVDWKIQLKGLVLIGKEKSGTFQKMLPYSSPTASTGFVFGIGPIEITVNTDEDEKTVSAYIIGPFVIIK